MQSAAGPGQPVISSCQREAESIPQPGWHEGGERRAEGEEEEEVAGGVTG